MSTPLIRNLLDPAHADHSTYLKRYMPTRPPLHTGGKDKNAPAARPVVCPTCGGKSLYSPANAFRPFCCERCKQVDLGAWASEDFRMPAEAPPTDAQYGDPRLDH